MRAPVGVKGMVYKRAYFGRFDGRGWPSLDQLRPYFLAPPGRRWFFETGNDCGGFEARSGEPGGDPATRRRQDWCHLCLTGHPTLGVFLNYTRWQANEQRKVNLYSKGDLARLRETVTDLHGTKTPIGLFVPYEIAWQATKQFIASDGEFPGSVEWVASSDLPDDIFPPP